VIAEPDGSQLCTRCGRNLPRIEGDACRRCGLPLGPYALDHDGSWCAGCENLPFAGFRRAAAFGTYEGVLGRAIRQFKYRRRPHLVKELGRFLADRARDEFARDGENSSADLVIPVPLHARRRRSRGFDQAELLAEPVAKALSLPLGSTVMERVVNTPTLTRQSREQRAETVKGAFAVRKPREVAGKCVLLVDDVMTTGATCSECARVLKKAGAKEVLVCVLARTP
jgi:ComF family protein